MKNRNTRIRGRRNSQRNGHRNGQQTDIMPIAELAARLNMCEKSVQKGLRRNEIPHIRVGVKRLVPRSAIETWLATAALKPVASTIR